MGFFEKKKENLNLALTTAVEKGITSDVENLIKNGANVNGPNTDGWFPLLLATKKEDIDLVKILLNNGADVNQLRPEISTLERMGFENSPKDIKNRGLTALIMACRKGATEIVKLLLSNGANVDIQDGDGFTALHCAAQYGYCYITESLLHKHATINMKTNIGYTPLILACGDRGDIKVVDLLLKNGADISACTREGRNALHQAAESGRHEIVSLLQEKTPLSGYQTKY